MTIDNQTLRLFAGSMAQCLAAGLPPQKALKLSVGRIPSQALQSAILTAGERCDQGQPLSEALAPAAKSFPRHFLPVIEAGELTGRQTEAFQMLYLHYTRIGPACRVVRNTWLYPSVCIVFGWLIRTGCLLWFGKYQAALHFVELTFGTTLLLLLAGWQLFKLPPVKRAVDFTLLQFPILRETEIRLGLVLFFSTFRLAYESGGLHVVRMFDLALATVRNAALREDLQSARAILARQGSFGEAFNQPEFLDDDIKGLICAGSLGGQLEESLAQIVEQATWRLELTLQVFNQFFQRWIVFSMAMSIVETLLICLQ